MRKQDSVFALSLILTLLGCDDDVRGADQDPSPLPAHCALPFDAGPCLAYGEVYWFNAQTGTCEKGVYGGCQGNENRFDTIETCEASCSTADD